MAEESLKIKFIADDGNLVKSINQIESELAGLQKKLKETTNIQVFKQTQIQINEYQKGLAKLGGQAGKTGKDFTNFGRVIQDLPYGFQGIQNNLTQLIPSVGALGLAFTGVVAALTFAQVGFGAWTRGMGGASAAANENTKRLKEAKAALQDYIDSLDDISKARVEGAQNAQEELVALKTLYTATQNANIPLAKRKELVDELQEQYPKYFGNIRDEIILVGGAKNAYDSLTKAILQKARAQAAEKAIADIQGQILGLEEQQNSNLKEQTKQLRLVQKARENLSNQPDFDPKGMAAVDSRSLQIQNDFNKQQGILNSLSKEGVNIQKQRNDLLERARRLTTELTSITEATPDVLLDPGAALPKPKNIKTEVNFFDKFLSFDPSKVKAKSKEFVQALDIAKEFALQNQDIFQGLDAILKEGNTQGAIDVAREWWENFQKGIYRLKTEPIDLSGTRPNFGTGISDLKEISSKIKIKPVLLTNTANQELISQYESFKKIGSEIGKRLGSGFDEEFKKIFDNAFLKAAKNGIGGQQMEEFMSSFAAASEVAAKGIQGVSNAFGSFVDAIMRGENGMEAFGETLKNTFRQIAVEITKAIVLAAILSALSGGKTSFLQAFGNVLKMSKGGFVPGTGNSDSVPAMLTPGEYVIPKNMAQRLKNSSIFNPFNAQSIGPQVQVLVPAVTLRGRDQVLQFARTSRHQRGLVGR